MLPEPLLQNLDGMHPFDLIAYAAELEGWQFGNVEDQNTRRHLANYACHKVTAMKYRLSGLIDLALEMERRADAAYHCLPDYARW